MLAKIYFYILILCEIWSQGIIGTFADEDIRESSNVLVRQKRVVNGVAGQDVTMSIRGVPYIVIVRRNGRINCVGSILSHHVVITVAPCVQFPIAEYQVMSATSRADRGVPHNVTNILKNLDHHPSRPADGIALLTVDPPFVYGTNTSFIPLHSALLLPGTLGIVSGWGYNFRCVNRGTSIPLCLRTIQVPIIAHQDCVTRYQRINIAISNKDICTYHPQKHCGHTDGGAPFVVEGHLVGIYLWNGLSGHQNGALYPDVFALLQDSVYNEWITTNKRNIEDHFRNIHG